MPSNHWLKLIRDHIATSYHLQRDDLGKMHELFGEDMDKIIEELDGGLVA